MATEPNTGAGGSTTRNARGASNDPMVYNDPSGGGPRDEYNSPPAQDGNNTPAPDQSAQNNTPSANASDADDANTGGDQANAAGSNGSQANDGQSGADGTGAPQSADGAGSTDNAGGGSTASNGGGSGSGSTGTSGSTNGGSGSSGSGGLVDLDGLGASVSDGLAAIGDGGIRAVASDIGGRVNLGDIGGLGNGGLGLANVLSNVGNIGNGGIASIVDNAGNTVGGLGGVNGGLIDTVTAPLGGGNGPLGGIGDGDIGSLVGGVGDTLAGLTGEGLGDLDQVVSNLTDGDTIANAAVGGGNTMAGTALAGTPVGTLGGGSPLLNANAFGASNSGNANNVAEVGIGSDLSGSNPLIDIAASGDGQPSSSGHLIDADAFPPTSQGGVSAGILTQPGDGSGSAFNGAVGDNDGQSIMAADVLTSGDQIEFPSLNGAGTDSLAGVLSGDLPAINGNGITTAPVTVATGGDPLLTLDVDSQAASGDTTTANDGSLLVNNPLHGSLV